MYLQLPDRISWAIVPNMCVVALHSQNHRIIQFGKNLLDHQVQPLTHHCLVN